MYTTTLPLQHMHMQSGGLKRLVEQISKLHKAHSSLQMQYEQVSDKLQQLVNERDRLQDELLMARNIPFRVSVVLFHGCKKSYIYIFACQLPITVQEGMHDRGHRRTSMHTQNTTWYASTD